MKLRFSLLYGFAAITLALSLAACKNSTGPNTTNNNNNNQQQSTGTLTAYPYGDTIGGINRQIANYYLQAGKTYYMDSSVVIPKGDTLLIQQGVTVIALNTGISNAAGSPEFQVFGTMICDGRKGAPIYLTVSQNLRQYANLTDVNSGSLWGGIECAAPNNPLAPAGSGDLILKWTHVEFAGGSAAASDPIVKGGGARYAVWYENPNGHFIMEDSWITGSTDDPLRVSGGKIAIFRNVIEGCAPTSGDFNFKSGTVGDIAYNLCIGICTNGPKLANTGGLNPETNVNIYNNTIVTCGWRVTESGRAGSTDIEGGARGLEYNNLIVNCRTGFRLLGGTSAADTSNTFYDYQWYYGSVDSIVSHFNSATDGGVQVWKQHDVHGGAGQNNPMFVAYNPDQFPAGQWNTFPMALTSQPVPMNIVRTMDEKGSQRFTDVSTSFKSDFHLQANSPCVGKAYTGQVIDALGNPIKIPMTSVGVQDSSATNPYGVVGRVGLGKDFGAYQIDGSGNQQ